MGVKELNKAAETFAGSNDQWVKSSQSFFLNVQRRLFQGTKGEEEQKVMLAKEKELEDKEAAHVRAVEKLAAATGELEAVRSKKPGIERLKQGHAQYKEWLASQLKECSDDLKKTTKRHQDYTYRMWGPFTSMWQNDVALAEREATQLERRKDDLVKQLNQATSDGVFDVQELEAAIVKEEAKLEKEIDNLLSPQESQLREDIEKLAAELDERRLRLRTLLVENGAASVSHLLMIRDTSQAFADSSLAASKNAKVLSGPIARQISTIACLLNQMMEAKTAKAQLKYLQGVVTIVTQKDDEAAIFFRRSQVLEAIGSPSASGFHWRLADLEDVTKTQGMLEVGSGAVPASSTTPSGRRQLVDIPESDESSDEGPTI